MPAENISRNAIVKKWIIILILTIAAGALLFYNSQFLKVSYNYIFKTSEFSANSNVYVSNAYYKDKDVEALGALRLIRPITENDVQKMNIAEAEKAELIKTLDASGKTYAAYVGVAFSLDSLKKNRSGFIGNFLRKAILVEQVINNNKVYYPQLLFAINPDRKSFIDTKYYSIPQNYTLADSNIYVEAEQVSAKELTGFQRK